MPRGMKASVEEHASILRAIEARNPARAREEMLKHITYAKYYMLDTKELTDIRLVAYESAASSAGGNHASAD
jgi:DNA-binding FadR family transcriptional regulator